MRLVCKDQEQLQSFFFFPSVPKEEIEEYNEADSKKNVKPLPLPPTDPPRSSTRKKRAKTEPYEGEIKKEVSKKRKTKNSCGNEDVEEVKEVKEVAKLSARWTAERYRKAETKLIEIVRERGGVRGKPLMRKELRDEARKVIGDTGLLDHLLKHSAGKVIGGGGGDERFMRRHNEDGAMVYWLEPRDLVGIETDEAGKRQECGVECREEIGRLKELVGSLRRYGIIKALFEDEINDR